MSSNYSSSFIFVCLLCLMVSLTTTTIVLGRHVGVTINKGLPHNHPTKILETPRSKQVNITWTGEEKTKVKVERNNKTQVLSKNNHNGTQEFEVMSQGERQDHGQNIFNYTQHIENTFRKTGVASLRVPKKKIKVSDNTGFFNLDYAPPKLHPPAHN